MSRTMIALVSDQRMQNVIPLFQRGLIFERVVLIASATENKINPRFAEIARCMREALEHRLPVELYPTPVDPMLPADTQGVCEKIIAEFGGAEHVTVNFTGGTKPMSIGAYQAARQAGAPMLYVDTQAEQVWLYTSDHLETQPFNLQPLGVSEFLLLHGKPVDTVKTEHARLSQADLALAHVILQERPQSLRTIAELHRLIALFKNRQREIIVDRRHWAACRALERSLEEHSYIHRAGSRVRLDRRGVDFLESRWLEGYVYLALRESAKFHSVESRLHLVGVANELDAACTFNAKLGIVECKSGVYEGRGVKEQKGQAALNKLRALKETLAGTFGKTFFVIGRNANELSRELHERAAEYVSRIIVLDELERVEQVIFDEMGKRSR